jgi:adenosylcobyric acid synthase
MGICGGYQMLGEDIIDECCAEGGGSVSGMGLLPVVTRFQAEKTRTKTEGKIKKIDGMFSPLADKKISGYEIHMGKTEPTNSVVCNFSYIGNKDDGYYNKNVIGTYLHGIFDETDFRRAFIGIVCKNKGIDYKADTGISYKEYKEIQYNKLADVLRENLDMKKIYEILEVNKNDR